ncbi:uncharacterized protein ACA1_241370 [Acanthamoeba castellanii str. Neff]|uniref:Uncharacterized protein n=1 Tax=Acanthamoeba castellanii (strain ATCC 30010 / Neff) TaxID=1257118 RepID=L8GJW0_ACACF|nr:uncharacterized protein ACA1_241370 [Acanthamoeba castellanii str. Neff]ELR13370.1 hypothetical protein ACA1_241370 [Acanthamoeba castellanii str. Neff]
MSRTNNGSFVTDLSCRQYNSTEVVIRNCSAQHHRPQTGRFKDHKCALFNGNTSEIITAVLEDHTFMEIRVTAAQHFGRPFAVILYSPTAHIESEVSRSQLCPDGSLANHPVDHQATSSDSPNFLAVTDTSYWAVLTQEQDNYLNGALAVSFDASTSSSVAGDVPQNGMVITFSYSSFAVSSNSQVVSYDWLTLVGTLGGAAAFACAMHEIAMLIYSKSVSCFCPSKVAEDSAQAPEEEPSVEECPVDHQATSSDSPNFLAVTDTSYWAVLTQEQDNYLNGASAVSFDASTSSSVAGDVPQNGMVITFSYSSFAVSSNSQVVSYDWLTLVGTLGGAAAFACAMHEIAMLIYSKSVSCFCPSKVAEDSAQAPEEEPSVEEARRLFPPPSAGQNVIRARPSARLDEVCAVLAPVLQTCWRTGRGEGGRAQTYNHGAAAAAQPQHHSRPTASHQLAKHLHKRL